jgi:hypothetical protein
MRPVKDIAGALCVAMALVLVAGSLQGQEVPSKDPLDITVSDLSLHPEKFDGQLVRVPALLVFGWEGDNFLLDPLKPSPISMPSRDPVAIWFYSSKHENEQQAYGPIADRRMVYGSFTGHFHFVPETRIVNAVFEPGPLQFEAVEVSILEPQSGSLARATLRGDVDEVRRILRSDAATNIREEYKNILLFQAVGAGHADWVQELLTGGADANFTAPGGDTGLLTAAWNCNLQIARALLGHGASADSANVNGETALILSSETCANGEMTQVLLDAKADPNAKTKNGMTALMAAVRNPFVAERLIMAGADPAAKDNYGNTAESDSCDRGAEGFYRVCQLVRKALGKSPCEPGSCN